MTDRISDDEEATFASGAGQGESEERHERICMSARLPTLQGVPPGSRKVAADFPGLGPDLDRGFRDRPCVPAGAFAADAENAGNAPRSFGGGCNPPRGNSVCAGEFSRALYGAPGKTF